MPSIHYAKLGKTVILLQIYILNRCIYKLHPCRIASFVIIFSETLKARSESRSRKCFTSKKKHWKLPNVFYEFFYRL